MVRGWTVLTRELLGWPFHDAGKQQVFRLRERTRKRVPSLRSR